VAAVALAENYRSGTSAWAAGLSLSRPSARSEIDGGRFGFQQARRPQPFRGPPCPAFARSGLRPASFLHAPWAGGGLNGPGRKLRRLASCLTRPLAHEPRRPRLGATRAFSRRPVSWAYRPFTGSIPMGCFGSNCRVRSGHKKAAPKTALWIPSSLRTSPPPLYDRSSAGGPVRYRREVGTILHRSQARRSPCCFRDNAALISADCGAGHR
jgi:hypothetical protein